MKWKIKVPIILTVEQHCIKWILYVYGINTFNTQQTIHIPK